MAILLNEKQWGRGARRARKGGRQPGGPHRRTAARLVPVTEHEHQHRLFAWRDDLLTVRPELANLFGVPNGAFLIGPREAQNLIDEGLEGGVPDTILLVPRGIYHGCAVELKSPAGSLSDDQRAWITRLRAQGYAAGAARGWERARDVYLQYLDFGVIHFKGFYYR